MDTSNINLFMGKLERDLLQQVERNPTTWWRYIDDIFTIRPHVRRRKPEKIHPHKVIIIEQSSLLPSGPEVCDVPRY